MEILDSIIIGSGPAGMTASSYLSRSNYNTKIIERGIYGGQMNNTAEIENYPGAGLVTGAELSEKMYLDMMKFKPSYIFDDIEDIKFLQQSNVWQVSGSDSTYFGKTVVIATGSESKKINVPGEQKFSGHGISYCAICDGAFFKNEEVLVVGGGDSALEEALYLSNIVNNVTIIHRKNIFSAQQYLIDAVNAKNNITVKFDTTLKEIHGDTRVEKVSLITKGTVSTQEVAGVFIYIGQTPNTEFITTLSGIKNQKGWIQTNLNMETIYPGLLAVGDVREKKLRQISTAVGEGAIAGQSIIDFLNKAEIKNENI